MSSQKGLTVVCSCETAPEFIAWLREAEPGLRPHLLILDLMVERQANVDPALVRRLVDAGLRVLVFSALASPPLVREIIRAGVGGVLGKRDTEEAVISAIWSVLKGDGWMTSEVAAAIAGDASRPVLSVQEERALVLYASGMTLDDVAVSIGVKPNTAKQYLSRVKAKYTATGRPASTKVDLTNLAWQDGYLDPSGPRPGHRQ